MLERAVFWDMQDIRPLFGWKEEEWARTETGKLLGGLADATEGIA